MNHFAHRHIVVLNFLLKDLDDELALHGADPLTSEEYSHFTHLLLLEHPCEKNKPCRARL